MQTLQQFIDAHKAPNHIRFAETPSECVAVFMQGLDSFRHELFRLSDYSVSACVSGNFVELQKKEIK